MFIRKTAFLAGLVVALVIAVGCGGDDKDKSSSNNQDQPPAQGTASQSGSGGNSDLSGFVDAFTKVKSFKAVITVDPAAGQQKQEGTMEVVLPDKYHLSFTSTGGAGSAVGGGNFEIISIGSDLYTKLGNNWMKQPGGGIGRIFDPKQISDLASGSKNYTKGGTDTVNGKKCQVYTQTEGSTTTELCLADNLPLRVVTSGSGSAKTTLVFSDYDKVGDIKAPI
jgi:hypothetical protein